MGRKKEIALEEGYKYFAFISYNSKDTKWGMRLQRKLEGYGMPSTLCKEKGWERKPIKPIFFAPTDIQPNELREELKGRLAASQHLIVICSPNSAKSEWVGWEMEYFSRIGRKDNIHLFIVEGEPHSADKAKECFNPVINKLFDNKLAANIHEKIYRLTYLNRQRAYVQLVSKLLNVEFDSIWRRHFRLLVEKIIGCSILFIAVVATIFCVYRMYQPVDINLKIKETSTINANLPPLKNAKAYLYVGEEVKQDSIKDINDEATFFNILKHYIDKDARLVVLCNDYLKIDTILKLSKTMEVGIVRDVKTYGMVRFQLYDESKGIFLTHKPITIEDYKLVTDENGEVDTLIPLEYQKEYYHISGDFELKVDSISFAREGSVVLFVN